LLQPTPPALQFAARACSLLLALALPAFAPQVLREPVPQVSPVFARLALPEPAPPVLQGPVYPVLQPWACPAWLVAVPFAPADRPPNFRQTTRASPFARANQEPSPRSKDLFRELLLNA
jgi:hypothetical protein